MAHGSSAGGRTAQDKEPVPCLVPDGRIEGRRLRGLSWNKTHQLWRVRIYYNGKLRFVGRFEDAITAAKAYDKAAVYLYGASAITNFGIEACLVDPSEVGSCIIRAKEEAEQQAAARQAADTGSSSSSGSSSNSSTPSRQQQQQQHCEMPHLSQSPQQTSPTTFSMACMRNSQLNVPSPSSDSSCYSMSQLDALLLFSGGCVEPAATTATTTAAPASMPLTLAAAAAMAGIAPFSGLDDSSSSMVDANLLHQISGMSVESFTGATTTQATATATGRPTAAMPASNGSGVGGFPLPQPMQYLAGQTGLNYCTRSTSLPGLGLPALAGNSHSLAGGFPDTMGTSARLAQLFITPAQQHQQQQSVAMIPAQLQFAGSVTTPDKMLHNSFATNAECTGKLLSAGRQQLSLTADCRAAVAAAATLAAAVGAPPGLSAYHHQMLLQQHQQQLLQQQLQELAVQEAMLSSTAAAAAAAAAAFPASASTMNLSLGGACSGLFGGHQHMCAAPSCAGNGGPAAPYTNSSLDCRWSMPL